MAAVVAPLFQEYVPPPDAVKVALLPIQMELFPEIDATGNGLTVTNLEVDAVHEFAFVTVTEYVVFVTGDTVIAAVVEALLQT